MYFQYRLNDHSPHKSRGYQLVEGLRMNLDSEKHAASTEGLLENFQLFNRMSNDLAKSYSALEQQVAELTRELERVNQLREQENNTRLKVTSKLSNLLEFLPGGVIVLDQWGNVSQTNPAAEELLGEKLSGQKWLNLIEKCFAPKSDDGHEISLKNGKRVSLATRSLEAELGQIILLTDQTETRNLQEQVSRNQRLTALGKMVSALAHQIRTPLSAALLYAGHLSERDFDSDQTKNYAGKIVSRLNHLEQQVRDMLIFAKGDVKLSDTLNINQLIIDVRQSIDVLLHANEVSLKITPSKVDAQIVCNRQVLVGSLANLVQNAVQASQPGQVIEWVTEVVGRSLKITIKDSGCGIEDSVLERLHREEAFVTTKAQGTGLGLAVVRAVIRAHQGELKISSRVKQGTEVIISLPCFAVEDNNVEGSEVESSASEG